MSCSGGSDDYGATGSSTTTLGFGVCDMILSNPPLAVKTGEPIIFSATGDPAMAIGLEDITVGEVGSKATAPACG